MAELRCGSCGTAAPGPTDWRCGACGSPLELELPPADPATFVDDERRRAVALSRLAAARRPRRARGAADGAGRPGHPRHGQARGRPADRVVQGPWHGGDRVVAAGARRARRSSSTRRATRVRRSPRTRLVPACGCGCSCPPTPRPPSCSRRVPMAPPWWPCRGHGPRPGRRPAGRSRVRDRTSRTARTSGSRRSSPGPRPSPTRSSRGSAAAPRTRSSRRSVAGRCCSASTSGSPRLRAAGLIDRAASTRRRPERRLRAAGPGVP